MPIFEANFAFVLSMLLITSASKLDGFAGLATGHGFEAEERRAENCHNSGKGGGEVTGGWESWGMGDNKSLNLVILVLN